MEVGKLLNLKAADAGNRLKYYLFRIFYSVGLVGLKLDETHKASWAVDLARSVSTAEISEATSVVIHPAFYRALGTNLKSR